MWKPAGAVYIHTNLTDSLHIHATKTDDVQPLLPFTKTLFVKLFFFSVWLTNIPSLIQNTIFVVYILNCFG